MGKVFTGQALAALVPPRVTLPFLRGDSADFSKAGQHPWAAREGHAPSPSQAASSCHLWAAEAWLPHYTLLGFSSHFGLFSPSLSVLRPAVILFQHLSENKTVCFLFSSQILTMQNWI